MKTLFIEVKTKKEALKIAPWAAIIIKVEGGYRVYESLADYERDKKQK